MWGGVPLGGVRWVMEAVCGRAWQHAQGGGVWGGGESHSAGAHVDPCQQCNYSSF